MASGDEMESRLADFERRIDGKLVSVANSVEKLATSVQSLVERDIRMQEKHSRQEETNDRVNSELSSVKLQVKEIELARATEKYAMDGMRKLWPYLVVAALVLAPAINAFITSMTKIAKGIGS